MLPKPGQANPLFVLPGQTALGSDNPLAAYFAAQRLTQKKVAAASAQAVALANSAKAKQVYDSIQTHPMDPQFAGRFPAGQAGENGQPAQRSLADLTIT